MKEKKNKKRLLLIVLLGVLSLTFVGGTVAWLTQTNTLTNSFTVGTFEIPTTKPTDGSQVSLDGHLYEPNWDENETHKLLPGSTFAKDPYVGIGQGSEDAVVYVYVKNNFSNKVYFNLNTGWEAVEAKDGYLTGTYTSGLFKYTAGLNDASGADVWTTKPLFDSVIVDDTAQAIDFELASGASSEIVVSSFIHQAKDGSGNAIDETEILQAAKNAFGI